MRRGTYIRSLARDLGERLGCGAYLGRSRPHEASGPFGLAAAHSLDEIVQAAAEGPAALAALLLPVDQGLDADPGSGADGGRSRGRRPRPAGQARDRPELEAGARVRLLAPDRSLVGIGSWKGGRLVPEKIFVAAPLCSGGETRTCPSR
jgi:tRNA pseudouridine55 synthase